MWENLNNFLILYENKKQITHPHIVQCTNRLMVTQLQYHVTAVIELLNVMASVEDAITPGRGTALFTLCTCTCFNVCVNI